MKIFVLLLLSILVSSCATMIAPYCAPDKAYEMGYNHAKEGQDMQSGWADDCKTGNIAEIKKSYVEGYRNKDATKPGFTQIVNQQPAPGININIGTGAKNSVGPDGGGFVCLEKYGKKECGYDCKEAYGKIKCAKIAGNNCIVSYGNISCGKFCREEYGQVKCDAKE